MDTIKLLKGSFLTALKVFKGNLRILKILILIFFCILVPYEKKYLSGM